MAESNSDELIAIWDKKIDGTRRILFYRASSEGEREDYRRRIEDYRRGKIIDRDLSKNLNLELDRVSKTKEKVEKNHGNSIASISGSGDNPPGDNDTPSPPDAPYQTTKKPILRDENHEAYEYSSHINSAPLEVVSESKFIITNDKQFAQRTINGKTSIYTKTATEISFYTRYITKRFKISTSNLEIDHSIGQDTNSGASLSDAELAIISRVLLLEKLSLSRKTLKKALEIYSNTIEVSESDPNTDRVQAQLLPTKASNFTHLAAVFRKLIFNQRSALQFFGGVSVVMGSAYLFWLIWKDLTPINPLIYNSVDSGFSTLQPIFLLAATFWIICLLLVVINPQTHQTRRDENAHEMLNQTLDRIKSHLTQMNLSVAALNISIDGKSINAHVDESWLRELDCKLKVKDSLVSVEKVILARQRDVGSKAEEVRENKEKARSAVTSSISSVGAGFLTYELGGAIKNFTLLKADKLHPAVVEDCKVQSNVMNEGIISTQHSENSLCIDGKLIHTELLDLNNKYREPELYAEATLLTITFIVSIIAAFIGWRKSVSE
ncbi:hypothetical protein AEP_00649 [Curvibacter sp. AEP1-3]|uniref:hypothetical protein n=1 Tax=Curvibacter sp. AEP1-3 TaxID=1844971 RepID=UPI000B3BEE2B|nr:hypothetical protein [Curvibacter sp. AEP1-3]ARV17609.1 hypothetical protein AEP_00649 [Curvibacter sp. AEP1-3]